MLFRNVSIWCTVIECVLVTAKSNVTILKLSLFYCFEHVRSLTYINQFWLNFKNLNSHKITEF